MNNYVSFGFFDEIAKVNSQPQSDTKQNIVDMEDLKNNIEDAPRLATLEKDVWLLDGTYFMYNGEDNIGFISNKVSDELGAFDLIDYPKLSISFNDGIYVEAVGLTLTFYSTGIAKDLKIIWYRDNEKILEKSISDNSEKTLIIEQSVEKYNKIDIEFYSTLKPVRFVKLICIDYGINKIFDESNITSADINYSVSPIGNEININTLNLKVFSETADFSILNPKGIYKLLQEKQRFDIFLNNKNVGTFYLKEWTADDDNNYTFTCEDAFGILDESEFMGGMYSNKDVKELIQEIFIDTDINVEIEDSVFGTVTGWLPIMSRKNALSNILLSNKLIAVTNNRDSILIKNLDTEKKGDVLSDDIFSGEKTLLRTLVTNVQVTEHNFVKDSSSEYEEVYNATLESGTYEIRFDNPYYDITITGGTIERKNENYAIINVVNSGDVVLKGKKYIENKVIKNKTLDKYTKENKIEITDCYLINSNNSNSILNNVFDYYQKRIERNLSYDWLERGNVGEVLGFETQFNEIKNCFIESLTIDFTSENATAKMIIWENVE